ISARAVVLTEEEKKQAKELSLLSAKPILVALNVDESDLKNTKEAEDNFAQKTSLNSDQVIAINAKVEEDLAGLSDSDAKDYLKDLGVAETGLKRLIQKAFTTLGLITFLTAGEKEVRAWTIRKGIVASQAAGVIHTDFEKKFIKAEIVNFEDFVNCGG